MADRAGAGRAGRGGRAAGHPRRWCGAALGGAARRWSALGVAVGRDRRPGGPDAGAAGAARSSGRSPARRRRADRRWAGWLRRGTVTVAGDGRAVRATPGPAAADGAAGRAGPSRRRPPSGPTDRDVRSGATPGDRSAGRTPGRPGTRSIAATTRPRAERGARDSAGPRPARLRRSARARRVWRVPGRGGPRPGRDQRVRSARASARARSAQIASQALPRAVRTLSSPTTARSTLGTRSAAAATTRAGDGGDEAAPRLRCVQWPWSTPQRSVRLAGAAGTPPTSLPESDDAGVVFPSVTPHVNATWDQPISRGCPAQPPRWPSDGCD